MRPERDSNLDQYYNQQLQFFPFQLDAYYAQRLEGPQNTSDQKWLELL